MNIYTRKLRRLTATFQRRRDRRMREFGGQINAWSRSVEERILGAVAASRTAESVLRRLGPVFQEAVDRSVRETNDFLADMFRWSYTAGTGDIVESVPLEVWVARNVPKWYAVPVGEGIREAGPIIDIDPRIKSIIDGVVSYEQAKAIVRQIEFGTPTIEQVTKSLGDKAWPDGLTVTQRIKTVQAEQLGRVADLIRTHMSGGQTGASAIDSLQKPLRELVGNDPGQVTGMNYRARRIARTEGVRVAQDALHESWSSTSDMFEGIRTYTAGDANVRPTHRHWNDKLFRQQPSGDYIAADGEVLPRFPAGPNCRCWDTPELLSDLTAGLPDVQLGA